MRSRVVTPVIVLVLIVAAPVFAGSAGLRFATHLVVAGNAGVRPGSIPISGAFFAEPSVAVDRTTNEIYVIAPVLDALYRSANGGAFFTPGPAIPADGDTDVAVDDAGTVYAGALSGPLPLSVSMDHGKTFVTHAVYPAAPMVGCDRNWVAARGAGHVVVTALCSSGNLAGVGNFSDELAFVSNDSGSSFAGPFTIATDVNVSGPPVFAPDGTLYLTYDSGSGLASSTSRDGGHTWTTHVIAARQGNIANRQTTFFPSTAADAGGTVYAVWSEMPVGANQTVFFSSSIDAGSTWSAPLPLSAPAGVAPLPLDGRHSAVFPWIVAGAAGKVAVVWYQATGPAGLPDGPLVDAEPPTTTWDVVAALSTNAADPAPAFTTDVAIKTFHTGSICTFGSACPGGFGLLNAPVPFDRRELDFFESALDRDGNLLFVYPQDIGIGLDSNTVLHSWTDVRLATQTAGPKIC